MCVDSAAVGQDSSPDATGYSDSDAVTAEVVVTEREGGGYEVIFREDDGTTAVLVVVGPDATAFTEQFVKGYASSYDVVTTTVGRG